MKKYLTLLAAMSLTACSTVSIEKQTGKLDAELEYDSNLPARVEQIAVVSAAVEQRAFQQRTTLEEVGAAVGLDIPADKVQKKYTKDLAEHLDDNMETFLVHQGFGYLGPVTASGDLKTKAKAGTYLIMEPTFDIQVGRDEIALTRYPAYLSEEGVVKVAGDATFRFIEPLTGEPVLETAVSLADLGISVPYLQQTKPDAELDDFTFNALDGRDADGELPEALIQSYDKAYADAVNALYRDLFATLEGELSRKALLTLAPDVDELKLSTMVK